MGPSIIVRNRGRDTNLTGIGTVGMAGGFIGEFIGASIDASLRSKREEKFQMEAEARDHSAQGVLEEALTNALQSRGYAVTYIEATREKNGEYLTDYPAASIETETYLDIAVQSYGYLDAGVNTRWRPMVWLKCRLVNADDHTVLMEKTIRYNSYGPIKGAVLLTPNEEYAFKDFDDVVADPERSLAGLDEAMIEVANAIAVEL